MNDYFLAVLLGIIEGLTEFLPVSSTAHLRIFESMAGVDLSDSYWKMFSIVIQLGAIATLPIYFRALLIDFLSTFPKGKNGDRTLFTHPLSLIMLAFVVTAGPAFLLKKIIGKNLENITAMGLALIIGGIVMWAVDYFYAGRNQPTKNIGQTTKSQAIWIGACQILSAVFPGTSRSMSTIAAGQIGGMTRPVALEFSFLLSIPTMIVATGYDLLKALRPGHDGGASGLVHFDSHGVILLVIGMAVSFVVAYMVVAWFMNWVRQRGFTIFAIYRIIAGVAVIFFQLGSKS